MKVRQGHIPDKNWAENLNITSGYWANIRTLFGVLDKYLLSSKRKAASQSYQRVYVELRFEIFN